MNFRAVFVAAMASLAVAQAQVIGHDQVRPFPQPDPVTVSQKTAVKFKPQLKIDAGCHPYPAVQKDGSMSGGLKWSGPQDGECTGSRLGSQIYARSAWVNDVWAIMYAWYFPKGRAATVPPDFLRFFGHRHNWEYVVVWIDNPGLENATVLGVSMSASIGYSKQAPTDVKYVDGTSVKVAYYYNHLLGNTALQLTEDTGEFQDLIQWDQLSSLARYSLNHTDWDQTLFGLAGLKMPLKDGVFEELLDKTWPF
uniref:Necrosis inducing-like protein NPP1 type n=1 Tax=Phytophthora ramorum TaxID=164328 RepID=H3GUZ1_PHYRM